MSCLEKTHPQSPPKRLSVILSPRKLPHELDSENSPQRVKRKAVDSPENSSISLKRLRRADEDVVTSSSRPLSNTATLNSYTKVLTPLENLEGSDKGRPQASRKLFDGSPTKSKSSPTKAQRTPRKSTPRKQPQTPSRTPSKTGSPMKTRSTPRKLNSTPRGQVRPTASNSPFQSPTANLPNYVFDPQPRTPRASPLAANQNSGSKAKTSNWLEALRQKKMEESEPGKGGVRDASSETKKTPGANAKTPRQRKSATKSAKKQVRSANP